MNIRNLFRSTRQPDVDTVDPTRFSLPDPQDDAKRATLACGDPCVAVSLTPRSMSGKLGRSLRVVLGRTADEKLPTDLRSLLKRMP